MAKFVAFIVLCVVICALGVSTPLGFWSFAPILGLALVAVSLLSDRGQA